MSKIPQSYTTQINIENGKTYYTGSVYPDKIFFDNHWRYGKGSTLVIPSNLVWNQITDTVPAIRELGAVKKILATKASQYPVGSIYKNSDEKNVNFYSAYGYAVTHRIPYSLGITTLMANMNFTKISEDIVQGSVVYELLPDEFDWEVNTGDEGNKVNPASGVKDAKKVKEGDSYIIGKLKEVGKELAGTGTAFKINYSGNTALKIEGTVTNSILAGLGIFGKYYPIEHSTRTQIPNYQSPLPSSSPSATIKAEQTVPPSILPPPDSTTRNSADFITDTSATNHRVIIKAGGTVWDAYIAQKKSATGFQDWNDFKAAVATSNPQIHDLNQIAAGTTLMLPEKMANGSVTYHYASGTRITSNEATGEYSMSVPRTDTIGGQIIHTRTKIGTQADGTPIYELKQVSTTNTGLEDVYYLARQAGQNGKIQSQSLIERSDTNGDGRADQTTTRNWLADDIHQSNTYGANVHPYMVSFATPASSHIHFGPVNYSLSDFAQRSAAEYRLHQLNQNHGLSQNSWNNFTSNTSNWLLSGGWGLKPSGAGGGEGFKLPSSWNAPIGAFYDSQSATYDNAPSIADKTPQALNLHSHTISASDLAARDTNHDGYLSVAEATDIRLWTDTNENGQIENSELLNVNDVIKSPDYNRVLKSADYAFYTRRHGQAGWLALPTMAAAPPVLPLATPAYTGVPPSHYLHWRTQDTVFPLSLGVYLWQPNQIKLTWNHNQYDNLIGTDGDDRFNINYYAQDNHVNRHLARVKNFIAGPGNDTMGGSERADNLWGGTGNDELQGYGGDDKLYGEEGNDKLFGHDGHDLLDGGVGDDTLLGGHGDDTAWGGEGDDHLQGDQGNDKLLGQAGHDTLLGVDGDDHLWGGEGNDELQGGEGADTLMGEAGNDRLFGQAGSDILIGGDGDDLLVGFTARNEAQQTLNPGETDNDALTGGAGNDKLLGGPGSDQLMGDTGDDQLLGEDGHDRLWGGEGKDELQGGAGNDELDGGSGDDRLFGQIGNDTLWGGDGNDLLMGFTGTNEAKQTLSADETDDDVLQGGAGNDILIGGLGNDQLHGGTDRDELQGGAGRDLLHGGDGNDNLFGQEGNDTLYGGEGDDYLNGFTASNETKKTLQAGESDNDFLFGGAGNDTLVGGLGNDYLDGGAGADIMIGGQGDDTYIVNSVNDQIYEKADQGYDTVITNSNTLLNAHIEELRLLEGYPIHGTGNALNNKIIGNSADNILDGVTGADILIGGRGNDTYYVDNSGDSVIEHSGEGTDVVQSSISYTLGAHLENLVLLDFAKPEKGVVDGKAVLVYGYPKRNELDYMQGDAVDNYEGTCALTSIANLLTQAGQPTSESQVVNLAINNNWAINNPNLPAYQRGGTSLHDQRNILTNYGFRNGTVIGYNEAGLANLLRSGRGIILGVNAGHLWNETAYVDNGGVNHAVTLTGTVYSEADGELAGFYLADSGRGKVGDMTRFVDIATFRQMANVANAYFIYTLEPIKYWEENINGTGNELDNQITGNRGNNVLIGGAGNDILAGGAGNDTLDGGVGNDVYHFNKGDGDDVIKDIEGDDTLIFGSGIAARDVQVSLDNSRLKIQLSGGSVEMQAGAGKLIEHVQFADGTVWDARSDGTGYNRRPLKGSEGNDRFIDKDGDDLIDGNKGVDVVVLQGYRAQYMLVGNPRAQATLSSPEGTDTLNNIESLEFADGTLHFSADAPIARIARLYKTVLGREGELLGLNWHTARLVEHKSLENVAQVFLDSAENLSSNGSLDDAQFVEHLYRNGLKRASEAEGHAFWLSHLKNGMSRAKLVCHISESEEAIMKHSLELEKEQGLLWDIDETVASVARLYIGVLGRLPDSEGLRTHCRSVQKDHQSLEEVAAALMNSNEFQRRYGTLDHTAFVDLLYRQALRREVDATGVALYGSSLSQGNTRAAIALAITTSAECQYKTEGLLVNGVALNNRLNGTTGNDILDGYGLGIELAGGAGNDTYLFGKGSGLSTIVENDPTAGNCDTLKINAGVQAEKIWFKRENNDLSISIIGSEDRVTIKDHYLGLASHIERFELSNGKVLHDAQVDQLVNAMAGFTPPPMGQTTLPADYQTALTPVIAASWH